METLKNFCSEFKWKHANNQQTKEKGERKNLVDLKDQLLILNKYIDI